MDRQNKQYVQRLDDEVPAASQRRQVRPFFLKMGPVSLSITCVLLMSLMAVLYLTQLGQSFSINQQLQDISTNQQILQRAEQDLAAVIAQRQSPAYIQQQATKDGLQPADPKNVKTLEIPDMTPVPSNDQP